MSRVGVLTFRRFFEFNDAKRIAKQKQDISDLAIRKDIPYIDDGEQGHLLDVYSLHGTDENAPIMINIHGGGLFASYKEVNANYNYEWARMGYRVVSISYRRIPETTLWNQIGDVMAAMRYIEKNRAELGLNLDRCYLTGDSAGALLCLFVLALHGSRKLQ
ncbi:MAG: alpha/beta hydrolase, partial [Spirochaetales bacterium]|nr:alpha/beta hydrolase [Spirochaetales bacterium]